MEKKSKFPLTQIMNPWAALWTSTASPRASVNVSVLQAGHIRQLKVEFSS